MATEPLLKHLETSLPCVFVPDADGNCRADLQGSETVITFTLATRELFVTTPVEGAHDGLPKTILTTLLKLNFPKNKIGNSWIRPARAAGHYELADGFTVISVTPADATDRILGQIRASVELGELIVEELKAVRPA